jgi:hypothetical protein
VIDNEDPEKVRAYLLQWMESELGEYLYICDPYFSNEDLDLVNLVSSVRGDCSIIIITGDTKKTDVSPDQQFRTTWKNISDAEPPDTEIVYATFSSGKPVFHDRGWITNKSGLKFGSSANAIGSPRISHISKLTRDELKKWRTDIDPFLNRVRNYKGEKVNYLSFYL